MSLERMAALRGGRPSPRGAQVATKARSAKSLLEPRVVAYGGEVVLSARLLAEPREQLDGPSKVGKRLVAGLARERCEAGVVVIDGRVFANDA